MRGICKYSKQKKEHFNFLSLFRLFHYHCYFILNMIQSRESNGHPITQTTSKNPCYLPIDETGQACFSLGKNSFRPSTSAHASEILKLISGNNQGRVPGFLGQKFDQLFKSISFWVVSVNN